MDLGLKERVVLVTGASGGIGRSVAAALAEEGARVVLHGHRGVDGLSAWLDEQPWKEQAVVLAADVRAQSVLGDCRFAGGNARESSVREHLLFESLFQPLDPNAARQRAETRCRVEVPKNATLAVQIGYKRPIRMEAGSTLIAEITAITADEKYEIPLLRERIAVEGMNVDGVRLPAVQRVDLSRFGGRELTLSFRTERQGRVKLSPFILETYGMFWQNPVFETAAASER